jgi:FkbM family methyltransferase
MKYFNQQVPIDGNWFTMRLETDGGGIQKSLRGKKAIGWEREPELLYVLKKLLKPGMTVMDLGANIGYITLLFANRIGSGGLIYAVEPDPLNYKLLRANIALNNLTPIVQHRNMAISNKTAALSFYQGKNERNLGSFKKHKKSNAIPISVEAETLTRYFGDKERMPELIKMDVEGHEVEILEGGYELFSKNTFPCTIAMELHPTLYSSCEKMEEQLRKYLDLGFEVKYVISAAVPIPDKFKEWGYTDPVATFPEPPRPGKRAVFDGFSQEHAIQACCYQHQQWMPGKQRFSPKIARYLVIGRG